MSDSAPRSTPFDEARFRGLQGAEWRPLSAFVCPLPPGAAELLPFELIERGRAIGVQLEEVGSERSGHVKLRFNDLYLYLHSGSLSVGATDASSESQCGPELAAALSAAQQFVSIEVMYDYPVLRRFHMVLQLICHLVPEALAVHDSARDVWMTRDWIRAAASRRAFPSPEHLFSIHVLEEDGWVWMHTRGLIRCGALELEVQGAMDRPEAEAMLRLLRTCAVRLTEARDPDEREPFDLGPSVRVAWVRWDTAYLERPAGSLGTPGHRAGCDGLVASLFRATGSGPETALHPITSLLPVLMDTPRWYATRSELQRASMIASKHWPRFRDVFKQKGETPGWHFEVALGYETEEDGDYIEQLWFEVHAIQGARVEATLLHAPVRLQHLEKGDRRWHAIDQLYQWRVDTAEESFGPEQVEALLAKAARPV